MCVRNVNSTVKTRVKIPYVACTSAEKSSESGNFFL